MPQLDTVTYFTQYLWTLICLIFLFSLLINRILPRLQQQLGIRANFGTVVDDKGDAPRVLILRLLFQQNDSR
uniref:ATP synthase F0 subunit 8 n=1 Tax=Amphimedon compressa TaxID=178514 RepID=I6LI66_AMPCM|nr:ATP synthase F0 subunit 8 [Amphimedon compressa]ABW76530.1 ATP synthase F0 subunit 8 [Amphimedon compressa]